MRADTDVREKESEGSLGDVTQLVESLSYKQKVGGSSPSISTVAVAQRQARPVVSRELCEFDPRQPPRTGRAKARPGGL
jgi:hypothetical protein